MLGDASLIRGALCRSSARMHFWCTGLGDAHCTGPEQPSILPKWELPLVPTVEVVG